MKQPLPSSQQFTSVLGLVGLIILGACKPDFLEPQVPVPPVPQPNPKPSTPNPAPSAAPTHPKELTRLQIELGIDSEVELKQFDTPVVSQFGGTCSAFATAAAMENVLAQKSQPKNLSERHLWSLYETYDAWYAVEAAEKNLVTEEKYWPINGGRDPAFRDYASTRITKSQEFEYNWKPALQALSMHKKPLVMAMQVPTDLANCRGMIRSTSGYTRGEHVVSAVGYQLDDAVPGGGYFIIKNSWGPDCGNGGYHYYPFSLCERDDLYCYFIQVQEVTSI